MKLLGVIIIVLSAASVGYGLSLQLCRSRRQLDQFLSALRLMRSEILFCATPLPQVFALMSVSTEGSLRSLLADVSRRMEQSRWLSPGRAMKEALLTSKSSRDKHLTDLLQMLADGLGNYDRESQLKTIEACEQQASAWRSRLEAESKLRSKTYGTLSICTGLAIAILFL